MEKYCTKCKAEYPENINFCTKCGIKLEEKKVEPKVEEPKPVPKAQETPTTTPPEPETIKPSKPVDKKIIPVVIIAFILSVAAILLPFVLGDAEADISAGSIGSDELASNSVTSSKINDGTITDDDISSLGISKIAAASITGDNLLGNIIDFSHLTADVSDAITGAGDIANNSLTGNKIKNYTIATVDIANNSITSEKIPADAITSSEIAANAVGASELASLSVDTGDIANDAVTFAKMAVKIQFGTSTTAINGTTITHNLGGTPTSVIVTPVFDNSNYVIHANIISVTSTQFTVGLWQETFTVPPVISAVSSAVTIYWIAVR